MNNKYRIIPLCFLLFFSLISCFSIVESTITMRDFNYAKNFENHKLENTVHAKLIFNPVIDISVTHETLFLKKIDSNFVKTIKENFKEKFKNCNIYCVENQSNDFVIVIDRINLKEYLVSSGYYERKSNVYNTTTENKILISIKGTIQKKGSQKKSIKIEVVHQTTSDRDLLFNTFEVKRDNTVTSGLIEENSIQNFAIKCAQLIKNRKL